ncbi:hypothetical protein [Streptomyces spirodelae]|uniref:Uncharacterized protein n=1 Tax=Streptomyces spirodelae TaxID=2812904 RepID=A0ABS3WX66_9ACTN|nr:hypothetical protein [Streptomyces spirodelae]MBO8187725.1 hypothetical protein [Streptomyces spirodelae]
MTDPEHYALAARAVGGDGSAPGGSSGPQPEPGPVAAHTATGPDGAGTPAPSRPGRPCGPGSVTPRER